MRPGRKLAWEPDVAQSSARTKAAKALHPGSGSPRSSRHALQELLDRHRGSDGGSAQLHDPIVDGSVPGPNLG